MFRHLRTTSATLLVLAGVMIATPVFAASVPTLWSLQSVDTMKFSRDSARGGLSESTIDQQVARVAQMGASTIAIGTPYDAEFLPVLQEWVAAARRHNLHVLFRGNFSGWEGWFDYAKITRSQHMQMTVQFIERNPNLFKDGDYFMACPECENGGPGDPRFTGDVAGHRQFLIAEHNAMAKAFAAINKNVDVSLNSMNGDVARLIMDKATTTALGGVVTVDHYVGTPQKLASDVKDFAARSGGVVVLGEWGAPIPDINGAMTPAQQAQWAKDALNLLVPLKELKGMNWWVLNGGSTALYSDNGVARPVVSVLKSYWQPSVLAGLVTDDLGHPIASASVTWNSRTVSTGGDGSFTMPYVSDKGSVSLAVSAPGYRPLTTLVTPNATTVSLKLVPERIGVWGRIFRWLAATLYKFFNL